MSSQPTYHDLALPSGVSIHYVTAGSPTLPNLLLLHGFPSSSFQFRALIPLLSAKYHIVAPDLPGFGFTTVPPSYAHTFENMSIAIEEFIDTVHLTSFAVYAFDYGSPTAFRIALRRPKLIKAIISQNGNAYEEGLSPFWDPLKAYWASGNRLDPIREQLRPFLASDELNKAPHYEGLSPEKAAKVDPNGYRFDYLQNIKDHEDVQLDLFFSYGTNVQLYIEFQTYLRETQVPVLAVWGKLDTIFPPEGAKAFLTNSPNAKIELLDGQHFLLGSHVEEVAAIMLDFLKDVKF
jgi:pimeloyl-ACP methyl ester carboxylesterase